ncbi:DUF4256 domain-containing protein [Acinetobacter wuhouensis]|uniref:DUF4256 domain-containing protein n=1 Tax=Acinetobacter wuhouensis TaxID=1879050 RepID=UPI001022F337|nr:DUF4256 domain-containing protein [Acinetobacter wuhouensis]RZG75667.1 DUF4256 domain-containing protein [Acinetobacter wuhouensis]
MDKALVDQTLELLKRRFEANMFRHSTLEWASVYEQLLLNPEKLNALFQMEQTGGEPDVVVMDSKSNVITFYDCSVESPKPRRSFCYDEEALKSRKDHLPQNSVISCVKQIGSQLLTEQEYRDLQSIFHFDFKASSWVQTPESIRSLGGAIFCDYRYGQVFTYHNGAQSYYSSRGFRTKLVI